MLVTSQSVTGVSLTFSTERQLVLQAGKATGTELHYGKNVHLDCSSRLTRQAKPSSQPVNLSSTQCSKDVRGQKPNKVTYMTQQINITGNKI